MVVPARACFAFSVSWAVFSVPVVHTVGALYLRVCMYMLHPFSLKKKFRCCMFRALGFFFFKEHNAWLELCWFFF